MLFNRNTISPELKEVQQLMADCLKDTRLSELLPSNNNVMAHGKMLRARLAVSMGKANKVEPDIYQRAAAAVEIIHGASLLHDDVIDGGILRRGAPTFWKEHGANGAILLGDLLVFKALSLISALEQPYILKELIEMAGVVCTAETEQELILRGSPGTWEECEQIARFKTGSLFAFAAFAAGGEDAGLRAALKEAGFRIGTAYQLADDILDASDNEEVAGKTLGQDDARGKTTAITAICNAPADSTAYVHSLCGASSEPLHDWPHIRAVWDDFVEMNLMPVLDKHLCAAGGK
ncbi:MAG: polyprenyl synthetase family protein [Kiritimatiellales bacterium]|nr:polyprenyl synthetase family protein [Kiritimatiellales bacterium]